MKRIRSSDWLHANARKTKHMPTGYTQKLMEEGQSFRDFVMLCARAMGACVEMRDDPLDATIPKRFKPSDYHRKRIKEDRAELTRLVGMSQHQKIKYGQAQKKSDIKRNEEWLARERAQNKRLREMEEQVAAWNPPTKDHSGLKKFMLEQLNISKGNSDYIERSLSAAISKAPMDYYTDAVKVAERSIANAAQHHDQEVERVNGRNDWIEQLRESI